MPISPETARALARVAAPLTVAALAVSFMAGCPGGAAGPTQPPIGPDITGIPTTSSTPRPGTPAPGSTGRSPTPVPIQTIRPVVTAPPQATKPPTSIFATPTPTPTPRQTPALEALGIAIDLGGSSSSSYRPNEFYIAFDTDNRLRPDLPSRRVYKAILLKGMSQALAASAGFQPGVYATESTTVDWALSDALILHTSTSSASSGKIDVKKAAYFLVNGEKATTARGAEVTIEVASVSAGTLLTFISTVSITTTADLKDGGAKTVSTEILASNEGQVDFVIQSLNRVGRPARLVP